MKRGLIFFLIILVVPLAYADWDFSSNEVTLVNQINQNIHIERFSEFSRVSRIHLNTTLFPKETTRQEILSQFSAPNTSMEGEWWVYQWRLPQNNINLSIATQLTIKNLLKSVSRRVEFPLTKIPAAYDKYTQPTDTINSDDPEIIKLASSIAEGEDDLYELLFKIGKWVHENINYSVDSEVKTVLKSAGWVLSRKKGACDEMAVMFMSLARAVRIPTRYVVGVAYSNMMEEPWQNHAWVEAYFPAHGWIPYDPAFGELGFVDTSHIEFFNSAEANAPPSLLTYEASNSNITISSPNITTEVVESKGSTAPYYRITLEPFKKYIGFGSHNFIMAIFNNTNNLYVADLVSLSRTSGLTNVDSRERFILLKPKEVRKEFFIVKTEDYLSDRYVYTYPVKIKTLRGYEAEGSFEAKKNFETFTKERLDNILKPYLREQSSKNKSLLKVLEMECGFTGNFSYVNDSLNFECKLKNLGNVILNNLKLCSPNQCKLANLAIGEEEIVLFEDKITTPGANDLIFTLEGSGLVLTDIVSLLIVDEPNLEITLLEFPEEVGYKDQFQIGFLVNSTRISEVRDVVVNLSHEYLSDSFLLNAFIDKRILRINLKGKDLKVGKNEFQILLSYKDLRGKEYSTTETIEVSLQNLNFVQRMPFWFRSFFRWLDKLFT